VVLQCIQQQKVRIFVAVLYIFVESGVRGIVEKGEGEWGRGDKFI